MKLLGCLKFVAPIGAACLVLISVAAQSASADWSLQRISSFAKNGVLRESTGQDPRIYLQPYSRGRLLIADSSSVQRIKASGKPDKSFGGDSYFYPRSYADFSQVTDVDPLTNGRILYSITGEDYDPYSTVQNLTVGVGIINQDGTRARKFASYGQFSRDHTYFSALAVARRRDGRILLAGGNGQGGVARLQLLNRNGSLNRNFGRKGRFRMRSRTDEGLTEFTDVLALSKGRALVTGFVGDRLIVAMVNRAGHLVRSFGHDGVWSRKRGIINGADTLAFDYASATLARTRKGFLLLARNDFWMSPRKYRAELISIRRNGRLDRSFGNDGIAELSHPGARRKFHPRTMTFGPGGQILVAGDLKVGIRGRAKTAIKSLSVRGKPNRGFARQGTFRFKVKGQISLSGITFDRRGRIYAAGVGRVRSSDYYGPGWSRLFVTAFRPSGR